MQLSSSLEVTLAAVVCLLFWAAWPAFVKRIGRLRWELFFYDFILGAALVALIGGFTLGTFGAEITFRDNIAIVGYRQLAYAGIAGGIFGLGTIMLVAAVAVAGAAVAGALVGAVALITGTIIAYFTSGVASTGVQFAGVALCLVLFPIIARFYGEILHVQKKDAIHKSPLRKKVESVSSGVVIVLCIVGGLGFGTFLPFLDWARGADLPMTAFPIAAMFTAGMFGVGFVLNLYFVNLPVQGDPISPLGYVRMPPAMHLVGLLAGLVFTVGLIAYLMLFESPAAVKAPRGVLVALPPAAIGLFAVLGRTVWSEFDDALYRTKTAFLAGGFCILLASILVIVGYL